jgi:hypothetical protein
LQFELFLQYAFEECHFFQCKRGESIVASHCCSPVLGGICSNGVPPCRTPGTGQKRPLSVPAGKAGCKNYLHFGDW